MNDQERAQHSVQEQLNSGISYNPKAGIQKQMDADGFWPANVRELYDGPVAYMGAEHSRTGESRLYQWTATRGVWWIPRPTGNEPVPPIEPPKDEFKARIGLHATSNGGGYSGADYGEFADLEPSVIKVMTNHDEYSIRKLSGQHPGVSWIVRVFYSTGGRAITPAKFFTETISDTKRTLAAIGSSKVVVELHNEPNLVGEGMFMGKWTAPSGETQAGWCGGDQFNDWYLTLLGMYRSVLPGVKFIFPGLSPGATIDGIRLNSWRFAEQCKSAIYASDGMGVHTYWAGDNTDKAMSVVDWFRGNFPMVPIWITEASNNKPWGAAEKAQQYADFWKRLRERSQVKGITYFVVSGAYPDEVWAGNEIGRMTRAAI